jgi:hypothetical protein
MRAASVSAKARSGAVVTCSEREPAENDTAIESAKCGGPGIEIQVPLSRVGTVEVCERVGRSGVGYDSLGGVVVFSRRGRRSLRGITLSTLAIRAAWASSAVAARRATTMTRGSCCVLFGTAGMGRFVARARLAAATDLRARAWTTTGTDWATITAVCGRCFRTSTRRRWQTLDGHREGGEPDQSASGGVLSYPHGKRSRRSPLDGRRGAYSFIRFVRNDFYRGSYRINLT